MVNTKQIQNKFLDTYGPIYDFDDHFHALRRFINDRLTQHRIDNQIIDNRLVGMKLTAQETNVPYLGESVASVKSRIINKKQIKDTHGYSGKIWLRFEKELNNSFSTFFHGAMLHFGGGGYSTWEGPWNEIGLKINSLETGVPWNLRRPFPAYCFSCFFYISDFPDLDQFAIMQKLGDTPGFPKIYDNFWKSPYLDKVDIDYINFLESYHNSRITR